MSGTVRTTVSRTVIAGGRSLSVGMAILSAVLGAWTVYLLLAPTMGVAWIDSWHDEQRAVQIVLASLTSLVFGGLVAWGPEPIRTRLTLPAWWWALVALGVVSALAALAPLAALAEVGLFVVLSTLVVLTAAATALRTEQAARVARHVALLIAAAHVLAVLVRYGASLHIGKGLDLSVFMLGYANPRFASALYAVLMPFVAAVVIDAQEHRLLRAAAFLALSLLWTINLGLGTRGIWFAYTLAVPALMLLGGVRMPLRLAIAVAASAVVGVLFFLALTTLPSAPSGPTASLTLPTERLQTLTSREVLWSLSWQAIVQHPLLGLGPMHFAALKSYVGAHPHNWPLQIAAEWGLPALIVLSFGLIRMLARARSAHSAGINVNTEALLAVAAGLAYGLVDGNLVMPVSQTAAALALGLAIGSLTSAPDFDADRRWPRATATAAAAVAAVVVAGYALSSVGEQPESTAAFRAAYPKEWLVPRFWEQGLLWNEGSSTPAR